MWLSQLWSTSSHECNHTQRQRTHPWISSKQTLEPWKSSNEENRSWKTNSSFSQQVSNVKTTTSKSISQSRYASLYLALVDVWEADVDLIFHPVFTPCAAVTPGSGWWCFTHTLRSVAPLPPSCLFTQLPSAPNNTFPRWSYSNSVTNKLRRVLTHVPCVLNVCHTTSLHWESENKQPLSVRVSTVNSTDNIQMCLLVQKFQRKCIVFTFLETEGLTHTKATSPYTRLLNHSTCL